MRAHTRVMSITIEPFVPRLHLDPLVRVLMKVRDRDPSYPPPIDVAHSAEAFRSWLTDEDALARWVAVDDGIVAGHVMVVKAHDYLEDYLRGIDYRARAENGFAEVAKVFVDPDFQRRGIAARLLNTGVGDAWTRDMQPALAVVETSTAAIRLYTREGLVQLGTFDGRHGVNIVMVDEKSDG